MRRVAFGSVVALAALTLFGSVPASADMVLSPFVGTTFGSGARDDIGDTSHLVYGATLTFAGDGILGFEIDGQYVPNFFSEADKSNVASLMGALLFGTNNADTGLRFYALAGGGLLRTRIDDSGEFFETDRNSFGIVLGGSVIAMFSENLGLKGDVRYFRGISDVKPNNEVDLDLTGFHFWRVSAGAALSF
jgi:hypothetical protein